MYVNIFDSNEREGYSQDAWMVAKIVGQHKQRPEDGIPEDGPLPKHRDTTICIHRRASNYFVDTIHPIYMCVYAHVPLTIRVMVTIRAVEGSRSKQPLPVNAP